MSLCSCSTHVEHLRRVKVSARVSSRNRGPRDLPPGLWSKQPVANAWSLPEAAELNRGACSTCRNTAKLRLRRRKHQRNVLLFRTV